MAARHLQIVRRNEPRSCPQRVGAMMHECAHLLTAPTLRRMWGLIMSVGLLSGLISSLSITIELWLWVISPLVGSITISLMVMIVLQRRDAGEAAHQLVPLIPACTVPIAIGLSILLSTTAGHVLGQHLIRLLQALQMCW